MSDRNEYLLHNNFNLGHIRAARPIKKESNVNGACYVLIALIVVFFACLTLNFMSFI